MPYPIRGHELFVSRIQESISRMCASGRPVVTAFLTLNEQELVKSLAGRHPLLFEGGRRNAQRALAVIGECDPFEEHCVVLKAELDCRYDALEHKQVLGALMRSGIEREVIGDIAVTESAVYVVCLAHMKDYVCSSVSRIGRQSVSFAPCNPMEMPAARYETVQVNVSSMRADALVAAIARCSRAQAAEKIRAGQVQVNEEILEQNGTLCNNDVISVRRCGKYRIAGIAKKTRKDRLVVELKKYC